MIVLERPRGLRLFFALRGSVLPRIAPSLATCTVLAVLVTLSQGVLFDWKVTLTTVPFSLIGLALAIFLGFRNGVAYDRWWEGRKLWGDLLHRSRSLARQVCTLMRTSERATDKAMSERMVRRTIAFAHALRHQLRASDPAADFTRWLDAEEAHAVAASSLPADRLLHAQAAELSAALREGRIHPQIVAEIDTQLSGLAAVAAGCERIQSTPIPFAYTLLLHRTAYLYCFLLPFGLVDSIGVMTPFVVAVVAYTFFGLDAVGDELEGPFGRKPNHLPLDALCRTVEINLLEALGVESQLAPLEPVDSVLH
jgi:putative membrane protein